MHRVNADPPGLRAQLAEVSSPLRLIDLLIFALIIGFGAFQFFYVARANDFVQEDVFYFFAAMSVLLVARIFEARCSVFQWVG